MKDYARGFYNSKAWRDTQAAFMSSRCYACERCGRPARIVHHIRRITPSNINDPLVTLDWTNLEALCMDCHNAEHMASPAIAAGLRFTSTGDIEPVVNTPLSSVRSSPQVTDCADQEAPPGKTTVTHNETR